MQSQTTPKSERIITIDAEEQFARERQVSHHYAGTLIDCARDAARAVGADPNLTAEAAIDAQARSLARLFGQPERLSREIADAYRRFYQ